MEGYISGRSVEMVKEFTLEVLDLYIDKYDEDTSSYSLLDLKTIKRSIANEVMLNKSDASILADILDEEVANKLEILQWTMRNGRGGRLVLKIDDLSIYSDAWGLYCRPGAFYSM